MSARGTWKENFSGLKNMSESHSKNQPCTPLTSSDINCQIYRYFEIDEIHFCEKYRSGSAL